MASAQRWGTGSPPKKTAVEVLKAIVTGYGTCLVASLEARIRIPAHDMDSLSSARKKADLNEAKS